MDQYLIDIMHQIDENHQKFLDKKFDDIVELTSIKSLPYEQKLNAIKLVLTNTEVIDNASILNLHLMIMGLQIIDQKELQENEHIWANSLKEFTDIVVDLREEIEALCLHEFCCFLGILKTFRTHVHEGLKVEILAPRDALLLESLTFLGIGNLMKKIHSDIALEDIPYYLQGEPTIHVMCNHFNIMNMISEDIKI